MNRDTFFDWFRNILPMLKDGAVIVMDNASYHSIKMEKYPNMTWRKNDMITWLASKGEKVEPYFVKAQLLELVKKYKKEQNYVIDEYAKQHGHEVLRLPPYHCELNPIELAWGYIKEYVRGRNVTYKLPDVRQLIYEAIENVSPVMWQNFIRHVTGQENRLQELDNITDSMLDDGAERVDSPASSSHSETDSK
ncbi:uncharacterized protein LOC128882722 [Hylaeus volcanicus]|uniref:uncharacterized protein LOC128882722 n=1 Tax=Hylaeus volcanicus TaxID=313075 RepID=UPI0023B78B83|nr:uncharacterized protein LOC128882722 [Hylaeus volcanicus]